MSSFPIFCEGSFTASHNESPVSAYCKKTYKQIGIDPPRGVLMYGPPGTGKTMLAKAVANNTDAAFIRVVGSEFVQKYLGEGPRMVRDVFRMVRFFSYQLP